MTDDLYAILGVSRDASPAAIKRAFRRKARESHPDLGGNAADFGRLRDAFDCLSDPERRAQYDRYGTTGDREAARQREKMLALFSFALDQAMLKLRQNTQGVRSDELMALMVERLRGRRGELSNEKSLLVKALAAAADVLARPDAANDLLREAVAKRKTACEERIAVVEADIALVDLCVQELGGAPAQTARPQAQASPWVDVYDTVG